MKNFNFDNHITVTGKTLQAKLELYVFQEDDMHIVYCPALDLSAYGSTNEDAKKEFVEVFGEHMRFCITQNTLADDLVSHGWIIHSKERVQSPSTEQMLSTNETLKDIVFNRRSYQKDEQNVQIPVFA